MLNRTNAKTLRVFKPITAFILMLLSIPVCALTLKEAVDLAYSNDPNFLAAQANLNVSRERATQALAGLLPKLTASANTNVNRRNYDLHSTTPVIASPTESFNSNSAQLSLTQPLWKQSGVIAFTQANLSADQSSYQLTAAAQELFLRLAQAWFDVMQARDGLLPTNAQVRVTHQQVEISEHGHDKGVLALTELEDSRAKYEQALADHAAAQSELEIKLASLEQIIGPIEFVPPLMTDEVIAQKFADHSLEEWLLQAETGNPNILAAQRALEAANEEIRKQRAEHEPTLDFIASYTSSAQGAGISGGQLGFNSRQSAIGMQFNMPLYAGGGQSAKVREALALKDKAMQELEIARRNSRLAAKQAWFSWRVSRVREISGLKTIQSTALALKGEQSARIRGVKSEHDVFLAEQQNATAVRDWRKARYDSILSQLKLKTACGQLSRDDLLALDQIFIPASDSRESFPK